MIDFTELTEKSRLYNFHSHTQFCDGRFPMADFVVAAVDGGFTHYGFSPHSPVPIESPCNMKRDDVPAYIAEYRRLKAEYEGRINLYLSMEIDYLGDDWGPSNPYFDTLPLDYRIGSIHFLPTPSGRLVDVDGPADRFERYLHDYFDGDLRGVVNLYFDRTEAMIAAGGLDIIGHFDKILMNGESVDPALPTYGWYKERVRRVIRLIAGTGVTAEINTKSIETRGRFSPDVSWWPMLKKSGIPVVVNSDAHYPALINAGRDKAFSLLDAIDGAVD